MRTLHALVASLALASAVAAQCGLDGTVSHARGVRFERSSSTLHGNAEAFCTWDDGTGTALYVGGEFDVAGDRAAKNVARWDGTRFTPLGAGVNGRVRTLHVHDDGTGQALYVGGDFTMAGGQPAPFLARWDGQSWSPVGSFAQTGSVAGCPVQGMPGGIRALATFGSDLYAGGAFDTVDGVTVNGIARHDGSLWTPLGSGLSCAFLSNAAPVVEAFAVWDDGNGADLYVGGRFITADGLVSRRLACWTGTTWCQVLYNGVGQNAVFDLMPWNGPSGSVLLIAHDTVSGGSAASYWTGTQLVSLPPFPAPNSGGSFTLYDDGNGAVPYHAGTARLHRFENGAWSTVPAPSGPSGNFSFNTIATYDLGQGEELVLGGRFKGSVSNGAEGLARWGGATWQPLLPGGAPSYVRHMAWHDDGTGAGHRLFAVGETLAVYDGVAWAELAASLPGRVEATAVHDDGGGSELFIGGRSPTGGWLLKWNGSALVPAVSTSFEVSSWDGILAMANQPVAGGPDVLWLGGQRLMGGLGVVRVVNGVGVPVPGGPLAWEPVRSLLPWQEGGQDVLYAGGALSPIGGILHNIMRYDGATWTRIETATIGPVGSLVAFDDGVSGPGVHANGRWRRDGNTWVQIGTATGAVGVFDDGTGGALYVAGAGTVQRYDGAAWSTVATLDPLAFVRHAYAGGGSLWLGGDVAVTAPDGRASTGVTRLGCPELAFSVSQSGGVGAPFTVTWSGCIPGRACFNVVTWDLSNPVGSGPLYGLAFSNPNVLLQQLSVPLGTPPFHAVAPAPSVTWGPFQLPPFTVDAVLAEYDVTTGTLGRVSSASRVVVQ